MPLNILKRDTVDLFNDWYKVKDDKLLFVTGGRKVGKTFEVNNYVKNNFTSYVFIDLAKINYDLFHKLMVFNAVNTSLNTVVVIDNIHLNVNLYKFIITFYKYLRYSVILIGDKLQTELNGLNSIETYNSVYEIELYPLSFTEFMHNIGIQDTNSDLTVKAYNVYRLIGGYPEVIDTFLSTKTYTDCKFVLSDILNIIVNDFLTARPKLINVLGHCKLLNYSLNFTDDLIKEFGKFLCISDLTVPAFLYLSGLIDYTIVFDGKSGIATNDKRYYLNDIGLLSYIAEVINYTESNYKGTLTECFVFNDLVHNLRSNFYQKNLYYILYDNYELDFAVITRNIIIGIEVKTNKGKTKSLNFFKLINLIQTGIKVGMYNKTYNKSSNIYTHPVYKTSEIDINKMLCFNFK